MSDRDHANVSPNRTASSHQTQLPADRRDDDVREDDESRPAAERRIGDRQGEYDWNWETKQWEQWQENLQEWKRADNMGPKLKRSSTTGIGRLSNGSNGKRTC